MEWQAAVLALQILMLSAGWALFQKARGELSAKAAEAPALAETKALHQNVRHLLAELSETSSQTAEELGRRVEEARALIEDLDERIAILTATEQAAMNASRSAPTLTVVETFAPARTAPPVQEARLGATVGSYASDAGAERTPSPMQERRKLVFELADSGSRTSEIARETEISEGEVETILALRSRA